MAKEDIDAKDIERKVHDLADSMNKVRSAQADRDDVVVDMKHAKLSRLELLAADLANVFEDVPVENEQFEFALTNGEVPRLWIDMTSFVRLGADGREYEFVKDTRLGRTILARSGNRKKMGRRITDYIAERILERERMIEGDWLSASAFLKDQDAAVGSAEELDAETKTNSVSKTDEQALAQTSMTTSEQTSSGTAEAQSEGSSGRVFTWAALFVGLLIALAAIAGIQISNQEGALYDLWLNWQASQGNTAN